MTRCRLTLVAALLCAAVGAQAAGIYTCVDGSGRRLTSDRPIPECLSRGQKELYPSGAVKREVAPTLTAAERAAQDERQRAQQREREREQAQQRRDAALVQRYPERRTHDAERERSIAQNDQLIRTAQARIDALKQEQNSVNAELQFYAKDPSKAPPALRRHADDTTQALAAQQRFIDEQRAEKLRTHARFDAELTRLQPLWAADARR